MLKEDFVNHKVLKYNPLITEFGELIVLGTPCSSFQSVLVSQSVQIFTLL